MGVLVISFDAVGDEAFEIMARDSKNYPNIARFKKEAYYQGGVKTVFVSNTYPAHASIATGKLPKDHGVISNILPPNQNGARPWAQMATCVKTKTVWDAAKEKGLTTAAILWPSTCGAKIDYNMPEVHTEKGQSRFFRGLRYGSLFFQLYAFIKYSGILAKALRKNKLRGIGQPALDTFSTAVTRNLLKGKKADLVLLHLLAYDHLFHLAKPGSKEREDAKKALDANLGRLLECSGEYTVIIFGDHSQFNIKENINLNALYKDAVFEQTGGSAFFREKISGLEKHAWFERYLTNEEMLESGYADKAVFGIAAKPGYCFSESNKYTGNHGYPADYARYNVFYGVRGNGFAPGSIPPGHEQTRLKRRLTDITGIIARELNLNMNQQKSTTSGLVWF